MKVILTKVLALGGLCALLAGAGNAASAQGYDHYGHRSGYWQETDYHRRPTSFGLRQRIEDLQREYAHDMRVGDYSGARRAHWRAQQLRMRLREHREFRD